MPEKEIVSLVCDIKHKKLFSSFDIAVKVEELTEKIISNGQWRTAQELMDLIRSNMRYISENLPQEAVAVNIMRHILKVIRTVYESCLNEKVEGQSLHHIVTGDQNDNLDYTKNINHLKTTLLDHLSEYKGELESSTENIAAQASEHIHMKEIILTVGDSNVILEFLKNAAKTRTFTVVVVEGAPGYYGHHLAVKLSKCNIETVVIPDTAVFAMMSRVNKVIIGTISVLANGGLRTRAGMHTVALAAKHYSVPVMVLAHMFKFSPIYVGSNEHEIFKVCASPANIIPYSTGKLLNKAQILHPIFDYVPPELVNLFICHQGGYAPSYVYHLLSEMYHHDDYEI